MTGQDFLGIQIGDTIAMPGRTDIVTLIETAYDYSVSPARQYNWKVWTQSGFSLMQSDNISIVSLRKHELNTPDNRPASDTLETVLVSHTHTNTHTKDFTMSTQNVNEWKLELLDMKADAMKQWRAGEIDIKRYKEMAAEIDAELATLPAADAPAVAASVTTPAADAKPNKTTVAGLSRSGRDAVAMTIVRESGGDAAKIQRMAVKAGFAAANHDPSTWELGNLLATRTGNNHTGDADQNSLESIIMVRLNPMIETANKKHNTNIPLVLRTTCQYAGKVFLVNAIGERLAALDAINTGKTLPVIQSVNLTGKDKDKHADPVQVGYVQPENTTTTTTTTTAASVPAADDKYSQADAIRKQLAGLPDNVIVAALTAAGLPIDAKPENKPAFTSEQLTVAGQVAGLPKTAAIAAIAAMFPSVDADALLAAVAGSKVETSGKVDADAKRQAAASDKAAFAAEINAYGDGLVTVFPGSSATAYKRHLAGVCNCDKAQNFLCRAFGNRSETSGGKGHKQGIKAQLSARPDLHPELTSKGKRPEFAAEFAASVDAE